MKVTFKVVDLVAEGNLPTDCVPVESASELQAVNVYRASVADGLILHGTSGWHSAWVNKINIYYPRCYNLWVRLDITHT